jgi:hypothetical protein
VSETGWSAVLAVALAVLWGARMSAQCDGTAWRCESRLRIERPWIAELVRVGTSRSATLRSLLAAIERSDGLVYLSEGPCMPRVKACLLMQLDQAGPNRMLRIQMTSGRPDDEAIIAAGHELQHAMEVLGDSRVRTTNDMFVLYQRIGLRTAASVMQFRTHFRFETAAAIQTSDAIRHELASKNQK